MAKTYRIPRLLAGTVMLWNCRKGLAGGRTLEEETRQILVLGWWEDYILTEIIKHRIAPCTHILGEGWATYPALSSLDGYGYAYAVGNRSKNFG